MDKRSKQTYSIPTSNINLAIKTLDKRRPPCEIQDDFTILKDKDLRIEAFKFIFIQKDATAHELDSSWAQCRKKLSDALYNTLAEHPSNYETFDFKIYVDIENFDAQFVTKTVTGMRVDKRERFESNLWKIIAKTREQLLTLSDGIKNTLWNVSITLIVTRELKHEKPALYLN